MKSIAKDMLVLYIANIMVVGLLLVGNWTLPNALLVLAWFAATTAWNFWRIGRFRASQSLAEPLKAALQHAPVILFAVDREMKLTLLEGDHKRHLIPDPEAAVGKAVADVFPEADKIIEPCQRAHQGQRVFSMLEHGGMLFDIRFLPLYDAQQQITGTVGVALDVTDRRRTDEALQRYAIRVEILRQIDQAILSLATSEEIAGATLDYLRFLIPYDAAMVSQVKQGNHVPLFVNPPDGLSREEQRQLLADEVRPLISMPMPNWYRLSLGEREVIFGHFEYQGVAGALWLVMPGVIDTEEPFEVLPEVTASLSVAIQQARLREQAQRYAGSLERQVEEQTQLASIASERAAAILQSSSDAIALVDARGHIDQTNHAFDVLFSSDVELLFEHIPDAAFRQALQDTVQTGQSQRVEVDVVRKDGESRSIDAALATVEISQTDSFDVVVSLRDITEAKRNEAKLRRALARERELSELRSRFIILVSHEFRTPLTTILSSAGLLGMSVDTMPDEQRQKHIHKINNAVRLMTDILDDVVTVGRGEANQLAFAPAPLSLKPYVSQLLDEVQQQYSRGHVMMAEYGGNCERVYIDRLHFSHLLTHILQNAMTYSPQGSSIWVKVACETDLLTISVRDEGMGIPEADQKDIFSPFYRAKNAEMMTGTGLGLAIAKKAADLHGGSLSFESHTDSGTTFFIKIPQTNTRREGTYDNRTRD